MKSLILGLLILLSFSTAFSQKLYFVYLQSEPEQPFFVKISEKIHSSTASGYLILSRLHDSSYAISIGFPQNKWPEYKFMIEMKSKDYGYLLKNFGGKGWGIYDMETMSIQMGVLANDNSMPKTEAKDVSVFTDILSKAANDPSLKEKPVAVKEEKPVVSQPPITKEEVKPFKDSAIAKKDQEPVIKKVEPPVADNKEESKKEDEKNITIEEKYKPSVVSKKSESPTTQGLALTFVDDYGNGKKDTISIIIPNQKANLAEVKEPLKEEKKFLDISANDSVKIIEPDQKLTEPETLPITQVVKNNCSADASESDFLKLRKKMAGVKSDDAMVDEAKKVFKTKCFSTLQIKNLSALFLNDGGKYKFFDAAYTHVNDPDNFSSLSAEMKDDYYLNRFKAMLR
jgi:Domain of unknown function (DUF4476)